MNRTEVKTIDDLPEVPFELVLSYLSLKDRLNWRAVSRGWHYRINSVKVKSLCFSERPSGFIYGKRRLISGTFAQNFIAAPRFEHFFNTFGRSILSDLKQLRICGMYNYSYQLDQVLQTVNLFGQLEWLGLFNFGDQCDDYFPTIKCELNLPMLTSFQLEGIWAYGELKLIAPKLREIKFARSAEMSLVIVHGESVKRLLTDMTDIAVENLKNLEVLYLRKYGEIDSTLLCDLNQLKEIHLFNRGDVENLIVQKQLFDRPDLKIYFHGGEPLDHLAAKPPRLADEMPFRYDLRYSAIEHVDPEVAIVDFLNRCTDLKRVIVNERFKSVRDIERFLGLLKNFDNIDTLEFHCGQPQELLDRLPRHCAVQTLVISLQPSDLAFLCRLKHLIKLKSHCSMNIELVRELLVGLPFLMHFTFWCENVWTEIDTLEISRWPDRKRFEIVCSKFCARESYIANGIDDAIQFIVDTAGP